MTDFPRDDRDVLHAATLLRTCLKGYYVPHIWTDILTRAHYEPSITKSTTFEPHPWTEKEQRRVTLTLPSGVHRSSIDSIEARVRLGDLVLFFGSAMCGSSMQSAACLSVLPPSSTPPHLLKEDLEQVNPPFMQMFGYEATCSRAEYCQDDMEALGFDADERDSELDDAATSTATDAPAHGLKQQLNLKDKRLANLAPGWKLVLAVPPLNGLEKISGCSLRVSLKARVNFEQMRIVESKG